MTVHYASLDPDRPHWLGGGQWMLRGLKEITVLFGRNGSGKSLLLRTLNESKNPRGTHYASPERTGDFVFDQNIAQQELEPSSRGSGRKGQNLSLHYRRESISRLFSLVSVLGLAAGHGEPVHQQKILLKVENALSELLPEFRFKITRKNPLYELERIGDIESLPIKVSNPIKELSSGEIETLTLALYLLTICNIWVV
jgi:energy-coupling factor transporter ATP-binding protein EcfA2